MTSRTRIVLRCLFTAGAAVVSLLLAGALVLLFGRLHIRESLDAYLRHHDWFVIVALPLILALMLFPFFAADLLFRRCMRAFDSRLNATAPSSNHKA